MPSRLWVLVLKRFRLHTIIAACLLLMAYICALFGSRLLAGFMLWASGSLSGFVFAEMTAKDMD